MSVRELSIDAPGRLYAHYGFESCPPGVRRRRIYVYLPAAYFLERRRFPVMLVLDGQNALGIQCERSWNLPQVMERLAARDQIAPPVLVGIAHSGQRLSEYVGWSEEPGHFHPAGDLHRRYLVEHVLPYVEERYRLNRRRSARFITGASAGGVAALYTALRHPELFSGVGILSAGRHYFAELERRYLAGSPPRARIFISCGTRGMDEELHPFTRAFVKQLKASGAEYRAVTRSGASHHERFWSAVLPDLLRYFFA